MPSRWGSEYSVELLVSPFWCIDKDLAACLATSAGLRPSFSPMQNFMFRIGPFSFLRSLINSATAGSITTSICSALDSKARGAYTPAKQMSSAPLTDIVITQLLCRGKWMGNVSLDIPSPEGIRARVQESGSFEASAVVASASFNFSATLSGTSKAKERPLRSSTTKTGLLPAVVMPIPLVAIIGLSMRSL